MKLWRVVRWVLLIGSLLVLGYFAWAVIYFFFFYEGR